MAEGSLAGLVSELVGDLGRLLRQELRLAKAEASQKLGQAERGLYAIAFGFAVAGCALIFLFQAVVVGLSTAMPAWLASALVGFALAALAAGLLCYGRRSLKAKNLLPRRALDSLSRDDPD
jgi:hypothetical protein